MEKQFDAILVGGSYAGLAAGMALGRAMRKVLIIDSGDPCNKQTPHSHNFITHDGRPPGEIASLAKQQVSLYPSVSFLNAYVTAGIQTANGFEIQTASGETFTAKKLVFATGIKDIMPDIPGFAACWGISALHCPYCHGYEVRHEKTGILANGDAGFELATLISNWTKDLTLYTHGKATFTDHQIMKLRGHKINIVENEIERLDHKGGQVERIVFRDDTSAPMKALYSRLPFVQHSSLPEAMGCALSPDGYIIIDPAHRTTVHGIYACGDNTTRMRTVANAVAMGTTTGMMVNKELIEEAF